MCLTVSLKHHYYNRYKEDPRPKTCDKDILVFKALNIVTYKFGAGYYSFYPSHDYVTPHMLNKVSFEDGQTDLEVDSFSFEYDFYSDPMVHKGIHSMQSYGTAKGLGDYVFYSIIPAGTEFYIGTLSDVVSKKIIIFESKEKFMEYRDSHKNSLIDFKEYLNGEKI